MPPLIPITEKGALFGGDPNRYIGEDTGKKDLHAYYIAPNVGKEAISQGTIYYARHPLHYHGSRGACRSEFTLTL